MIKTIVKQDNLGVILFFPEYAANSGFMMYWTPSEGHGEACLDYMRRCKRIDIQNEIVQKILNQYERLGEYEKTVICFRDTKKMQAIRYKWNFKG